jgi:hypothetical protein
MSPRHGPHECARHVAYSDSAQRNCGAFEPSAPKSFGSALIAALVIGFVSATVGLILKIILLPFILLSLGWFTS